jgi:hypothetical protein
LGCHVRKTASVKNSTGLYLTIVFKEPIMNHRFSGRTAAFPLAATALATAALCLTIGAIASSALAEDSPFAVGVSLGTQGIGLTGQYKFSDYVVGRADLDSFTFQKNFTSDNITYDGHVKFSNLGVAADFHPMKSDLYLRLGIDSGTRDVNMTSTPSSNTVIGGTSYTPSQIGTITTKVAFPKSSTLVGIGTDGSLYKDAGFHVGTFFGLQLSSAPATTMSATGLLATDPTFQANLAKEKTSVQDSVKDFKTYPVFKITANYRY